jgi:hypothetical protein
MKLFKLGFCFALLVAVSLPAVAQATLRANIPFNFTVAGKSFPAGHYRVAKVSYDFAWSVSDGRGAAAMILTNPVESTGHAHPPSLVFIAVNGTYSLVEFWPTANVGRELLLKPKVKTTILAEGAKYVEIGAE